MNALVHKEVRLLLPVWIAAVVQAVLPTLFFWTVNQELPPELLFYVPFGLGILLLGLSSFGYEFGIGTFSIYLAQPIPRLQIWRLKTRLLAGALFSVWFAVVLSLCVVTGLQGRFSSPLPSIVDLLAVTAMMTLTVFASVLWTTLLFRQMAAAFWFTILIPSFITVFLWSAVEKKSEPLAFAAVFGALLLYSLAGFFFARWMFMRAQDAAWTGGEISLPAWLGFRTQAPAQVVVPKLKPLRALVRKEFQSHHITLLIGALLLVSHLVGIAVRKLEYDPSNPDKAAFTIFGFWWLLWFALPMIIGATVVAEERKLGTLEGQLCLPVKRGWQFAVKFFPALLLGVFLGGLMPAVCEGLAIWVGVPGEFPSAKVPEFLQWLEVCCLIATGTTLISIYASTLTRNLLQALGTGVLIAMGMCGFGVLVVQQEHFVAPLWTGPLGIFIGLPVLVLTLTGLAYKNFKRLQVGLKLWLRNAFTVLAAMVLIAVATTVIWNRVWELGMTLEPAHGLARLTGAVRPDINLAWGGKIFALLPDGRVWVQNKFQVLNGGKERVNLNGEETTRIIKIPIPTGGTFLAGSNWIQLASSYGAVMGTKSDGSLWNIFRADTTNYLANLSSNPQPERLGTDADWKTVAGNWHGFFALKQDGSLWTWTRSSRMPERSGHNSDWTAIFAARQSFAGIERDGSIWKWGHLQHGPGSSQVVDRDWKQEHPEPVQWYPAGGDWQSIAVNDNFDLLLKRDGTLWACGQLPEIIFGSKVNLPGPFSRFSAAPVQIGTGADFADIKLDWGTMLVLKKNGTIYHHNLHWYDRAPFLWGSVWKLSQHSDWIAIQHQDWSQAGMALAADGTLSDWGDPRGASQNLLGPSRKPLWTLNLFDATK